MGFASAKHALGICDRCGGTFKLLSLRREVQDGNLQSSLLCTSCFDPDHPQWKVKAVVDHEGLQNPRPDTPDRNIVWGWGPVYGLESTVALGSVGTS